MRSKLLVATIAVATLGTPAVSAAAPAPSKPIDIRLMAINDLHGNISPPSGSSGTVRTSDGQSVPAGGAAYLATHVNQLRAQQPNSLLISSGDNIGASPLNSALFHDEPTIDVLNAMGVAASTVGNHELDEGYREMLRMEFGGCHPTDGCQFDKTYRGERFPTLAANMTYHHLPAAAPFTVKFVHGVPVGIIGVPLRDMASVVSAQSLKGLEFSDEVAAVNRSADLLDLLGVKTIVASEHQGDEGTGGGPNDCAIDPGPGSAIAKAVSPKVDAVFAAHTHQQYNCTVTDPAGNPRPYIQGASFGRLLSVVDFRIDPRTKDVIRDQTRAHNEIVTRDVTPDPKVAAIVKRADELAAPKANKPVGKITADLVRAPNEAGESPLGDVIADAQLAGTKAANAQLALMNPGGIRADLLYPSSSAGEGDGVVTYGESYSTQPFSNILQTVTLTGAQLKTVLEQQWRKDASGSVSTNFLQISKSLHYRWSAGAPIGSKVSDITVDGKAVEPAGKYRVTANNFLTGGGDGFAELAKGSDVTTGGIDLDVLNEYLQANQPLSPPAADRIGKVS